VPGIGSVMRSSGRRSLWQRIVLGGLILIWISLSGLFVVSRLDPETFLRKAFAGYSRPDAFSHDLNRVAFLFWAVHSCLVLTALSATRQRRPDVLVILLVGPAIGLVLGLLSQQWSDPDWIVFLGVCLMGWLASTLVGLAYWGVRPAGKPV
jgi:hypothetical protein